VALGHR